MVSTPTIEKPSDSKFVADLRADQIKITILNVSAVKKSLSSTDYVIVNREISAAKQSKFDILNGSTTCSVVSTDTKTWNSKIKTSLKLSAIAKNEVTADNGRRRLAMILEDASLSLVCTKLNSNPFTMKEVRAAVKGIMEITVSK